MRVFPAACLILASSIATLSADVYTSTGSGLWDAANTGIWSPAGNPQTGSFDSISILTGHVIEFAGTAPAGLPGSNDLGVANNQVININGGVLTQSPPNYWIRIGHETDGTLNINDGRFHFTNSTAAAAPNLQIGIRGARGLVNIGDGIGAAGSAVLNLRDIVNGTANVANVSLNLGVSEGSFGPGVGTLVINSDGVLEGDTRIGSGNNPVIRIGQHSTEESSITVKAGGQFRAHGTLEVGSNVGTFGLLRIDGANARLDMDGGELNVGFNGTGSLIIENGGTFSRVNTPSERLDLLIGREGPGTGSVVVQSGGKLLRGPATPGGDAGNVGDMRIGLRGTGTMTINDGGLVQNDSGNWDWIGQNTGGNGTLTINTGGTFRTTAGSNFIVGVDGGSTGLVVVNGGLLDLSTAGGSGNIRLGQNGTATFRQISGTTNASSVNMAENLGTVTFDLQGGDFTSRGSFFMGGAGNASAGTGTATGTQSGGTLNVAGAFVVGLAPSHTATYTMTGGRIVHTGSDISVGESGIGTMRIGANATLEDTTGGLFFVGRNEGSSGSLIVDGTLTRTSFNAMRVGNGNDGNDNTTAPGVLGGTGSITSGIRIGAHGTLTGGALNTVGTLNITGDLNFSFNGTFFANFGTTGTSDRINLTGFANIDGALLDGDWTGGITGLLSRYWLLVNDSDDPILGSFANVSLTSSNAQLFPDADAWTIIDGQEFAIFYDANFETNALSGGNDLLLAAVPEPSAALLLGSGLALAFGRRRRKSA